MYHNPPFRNFTDAFPVDTKAYNVGLSGCLAQSRKSLWEFNMPNFPNEAVTKVRHRLLDGMASYMTRSADCGYTQLHIDRCAAILDGYLAAMTPDRQRTDEQILSLVKQTVLKLNDLNAETGSLIETDQREDLCQLIQTAATQAGLKTTDDVTEEWRLW